MNPFSYKTHAVKVVFGKRTLEAIQDNFPEGKSIKLGVIASKRNAELVNEIAKLDRVEAVFHFDKVAQHVPMSLVDEAKSFFVDKKPDIIFCLGGGSAIGLGKALVLEIETELWAAPSTYSGSEMTNIYGISHDGVKTVKRDDRVHPKFVIFDPYLSLGMPLELAIPSAFNAMAHLVEAVYSIEGNPITDNLTSLGLSKLYSGLKELKKKGVLTPEINQELLFGAYIGGKVLCEVSMGLHHKAAHVLGGNFGLEHSHIHTLLLPYVLEYQWEYLDDLQQNLYNEAFGFGHPPSIIRDLQENLGVAYDLQGLGLKQEDITKAVDYLMAMTYPNPAPMDRDKLIQMLTKAF
ncbi:maleylacetate reductase [Belliella buryatensis]|uniref:Maleylacetate reductase n=1 Tax=Belliella buryatensis TaxID=1500549 RepID=A0A239C7Y3_9BACT|nr:maleylacetate reductase [Belliella buryatensis]SNS15731.1 maleylacetate reductase [Belliella buryatensis]